MVVKRLWCLLTCHVWDYEYRPEPILAGGYASRLFGTCRRCGAERSVNP